MVSLFISFIKYHFAGLIKFLLYSNYRRYFFIKARYCGLSRYKKRTIRLYGNKFIFPDINSFLSAYYAIFIEKTYQFKVDVTEPFIIDCGANIGLSVLFFKEIFPDSKIIAFEADPFIFEILKLNITNAKLKNVTLINKALWMHDGFFPFKLEGADSGRIELENSEATLIPTIKLSRFLGKQKVDFLKIDIEGAEVKVIKECQKYLYNVTYAFVEFHSFQQREQELDIILNAFQKHGFRYYIKTIEIPRNPYLHISHDSNDIDLSLNISFISNQ